MESPGIAPGSKSNFKVDFHARRSNWVANKDRQPVGYRSAQPSNRPRKGWKLYDSTYNDASPHIGVCGSTGGDLCHHCKLAFDNSGFLSFYRALVPGMSLSSLYTSVDPMRPLSSLQVTNYHSLSNPAQLWSLYFQP